MLDMEILWKEKIKHLAPSVFIFSVPNILIVVVKNIKHWKIEKDCVACIPGGAKKLV
jgi:hypothetical protein